MSRKGNITHMNDRIHTGYAVLNMLPMALPESIEL